MRKRPRLAVGIAGIGRRQLAPERSRNIARLIASPGAGAIENVAVLRIGKHDAALTGKTSRLPVAKGEYTHARPGTHADSAGILLRAVEPIWKAIVRGNMIDLRGGLVVPGAPRLRPIERDDGTLIALEHHALRISGVDPDLVV